MRHTSQELKKIFSEKVLGMQDKITTPKGKYFKEMRIRLHEEFDEVWVNYLNNQATYDQWEKALNKWLNAEMI